MAKFKYRQKKYKKPGKITQVRDIFTFGAVFNSFKKCLPDICSTILQNILMFFTIDIGVLLFKATDHGFLSVIKLLHIIGYDLNITGYEKNTLFLLAVRKGHVDIVKFLYSCGANIETPDNEKRTPLDAALSEEHFNVARFLHSCNNKGLNIII